MITSIHLPDSSWYTPALHNNKRLLRKAEISYSNNSTAETLNNYKLLKNAYRNDIITAKNAYISSKFQQLNNDSKSIHRLSARLLGRRLRPLLPSGTPEDLPILFDTYVNAKLINIISSLPTPTISTNTWHL